MNSRKEHVQRNSPCIPHRSTSLIMGTSVTPLPRATSLPDSSAINDVNIFVLGNPKRNCNLDTNPEQQTHKPKTVGLPASARRIHPARVLSQRSPPILLVKLTGLHESCGWVRFALCGACSALARRWEFLR